MKEIRAGEARARAAGGALPAPARAEGRQPLAAE